MIMLVSKILGPQVGPNIETNSSHNVTVIATSTTNGIQLYNVIPIAEYIKSTGLLSIYLGAN